VISGRKQNKTNSTTRLALQLHSPAGGGAGPVPHFDLSFVDVSSTYYTSNFRFWQTTHQI